MKNFLSCIILIFLGAFISCQESAAKKINGTAPVETTQVSSSKSTIDGPVMTFNKTTHDFGTINEGDKVTTEFSFTNTGSADLIIVDARGSCGCTVPKYPKNTAIKPGQSETITVSFDSSNKPGMQQKSVTLSANTLSLIHI